jgi:GH15 family glucan-1,4-alpha-glucosidase
MSDEQSIAYTSPSRNILEPTIARWHHWVEKLRTTGKTIMSFPRTLGHALLVTWLG